MTFAGRLRRLPLKSLARLSGLNYETSMANSKARTPRHLRIQSHSFKFTRSTITVHSLVAKGSRKTKMKSEAHA